MACLLCITTAAAGGIVLYNALAEPFARLLPWLRPHYAYLQ
ncbi:hypothetical protein midi_01149 [Candidatus Midichloria mitochondrii IricVA]|uniref:Uncharacterized protein n=1 Tax=Midichloria mitochondrii (strain IricVA) TaxID=696127 RepID=F7XU66_MIDMI|nr:hypothetical protein midi_01149 [Candidatus Midichloria mitochondrii IricVA]